MGVLVLSIMYDVFFNVTYVYFLYFSLDYVFDRHICIWQLNTNYNKLK
jgi:hypothetical protein